MKKMGIFLDTGFYMALINKSDKNHEKSKEILQKIKSGIYGQVYSSLFIMSETGTLAAIRTQRNSAIIKELKRLFIGELKIATPLEISASILEKTWNLYIKKLISEKNKGKRSFLSFIDSSNIILCQEHQIENIVAFDGDFEGWLNVVIN